MDEPSAERKPASPKPDIQKDADSDFAELNPLDDVDVSDQMVRKKKVMKETLRELFLNQFSSSAFQYSVYVVMLKDIAILEKVWQQPVDRHVFPWGSTCFPHTITVSAIKQVKYSAVQHQSIK